MSGPTSPIPLTTYVLWTCHGCGRTKVKTIVPARDNESVIEWTEATMRYLAAVHVKLAPFCSAITLDLMVPTQGTDRVGGPVRQ